MTMDMEAVVIDAELKENAVESAEHSENGRRSRPHRPPKLKPLRAEDESDLQRFLERLEALPVKLNGSRKK